MENENAQLLIKKYLNGTCTELERQIVEGWYLKELAEENDLPPADFNAVRKQLDQSLAIERKPSRFPQFAVAASILLALITTFYFFKVREPVKRELAQHTEILPGGNKAFLITAKGERISLTDAKIGKLSDADGIEIRKDSDGILSYQFSNTPVTGLRYNTVETPKGGQFKVRLPDGSAVWLNAGSKLTFPTSFAALKERRVALSGEAYFEVAKDKVHPFVVKTDKQNVQVLGTHFNINSYADESSVTTTLIEGSVKVYTPSGFKILKPDQQALLAGGVFRVSDVDSEEAISWKNGLFVFDNESIESVMRKIGRWYDVEIEFQTTDRSQFFTGTISRFEQVSKVLDKLELTGGVHFKIKERRIIVMK